MQPNDFVVNLMNSLFFNIWSYGIVVLLVLVVLVVLVLVALILFVIVRFVDIVHRRCSIDYQTLWLLSDG